MVLKIVTFNLAGAVIAAGLLVMQQGDYWQGLLLWLVGLALNVAGAVLRT